MFQVLAPRIQSEHPKTAELAALCGNLPLAVSLLARIFTKHPSWTIDDLIRETRARLLTAAAEDRSIAAAFQLSYQNLEPSRQSFFRLLGQFPGTVLDAYSAAALADVSLGRAVAHLDGLHSDRLFEEVAYRRYRMHDLIREYARSLATAGDSDDRHGQAVERILDYYQYTAGVSSRYLSRWSRPPAGDSAPTPAAAPPIGDGRQALAWFAAEDSNLMACISYAARNSKFARTIDLTSAIAAYLGSNGPRTRAIASHTSAVAAARRLGRHLDEANALHDLGAAQYLAEDFTASADSFRRALELYRHLGNRLGEANALNQLGTLHRTTHDYESAAQAQQQALDLYRGSGDTLGEANALAEQGIIHYLADEYQHARPELQDALNFYRSLGNSLGEAHVLIYLGAVPPNGDLRDAARHLRQALEIYGSYDDRLRQADVLNQLGYVLGVTRDHEEALQALQRSVDIYRTLGNQLGEANALNRLGAALRGTGDYPAAVDALEDALRIYRRSGNRLGEADALNDQAAVHTLTGDYSLAGLMLEQSLTIFRDLGQRLGEAEALNNMGDLKLRTGNQAEAKELYERAFNTADQISELEQARALEGIGRCAGIRGEKNEEERALRRARDIYEQLGVTPAGQDSTTSSLINRQRKPQSH
jgi:tetratricopeptide (TPR) repeat protein